MAARGRSVVTNGAATVTATPLRLVGEAERRHVGEGKACAATPLLVALHRRPPPPARTASPAPPLSLPFLPASPPPPRRRVAVAAQATGARRAGAGMGECSTTGPRADAVQAHRCRRRCWRVAFAAPRAGTRRPQRRCQRTSSRMHHQWWASAAAGDRKSVV